MKINHEALKAIRERTGMTVTELGRRSGIDRANITHIEAGRRRGTPAQAKALAEALLVPTTAILANELTDFVVETPTAVVA